MSDVLPTVAHGQVEINDHLQHMKIPLGTRQVLVGAVAVRQADGATAVSSLRTRYVAIRAGEGCPVACYVHRTMLSVALDPDVAATVCAAHRYCVPEPDEHSATTRHVRIKHADVRMYAPIVGELLLVALQRSSERTDLTDQAEDQPPAALREGPAAGSAGRAPSRTRAGARGAGTGAGVRTEAGVADLGQPSPTSRPIAPVGQVRERDRSTSRTSSTSPPPRPAPAMCPIHFHPLINGECDYCA